MLVKYREEWYANENDVGDPKKKDVPEGIQRLP